MGGYGVTDFVWPLVSIGIGGLIVLIGIVYVLIRIREKKSGFPARDERTQQIQGRAAQYALYIGLYFMVAVMFVLIIGREFFDMPDPGASPVVVASILVFSITDLVFSWYLQRTGNRE